MENRIGREGPGLERGSIESFRTLIALLFFALFLITVIFVFSDRTRQIESELGRLSQVFARDLSETLRLSVESLRSVSNFLVFNEDLTYQQFIELTDRSLSSDAGLLLVEWQPRVAGSRRADFVEKARRRGLPEFRLWELDEAGVPVPAASRLEHVPVYMMHGRAQYGLSTLGLDLAWSAERMVSKWRARDTGRAMSSQLFRVVTGRSTDFSPLGFAITVPVYERGYAPDTLDGRREELIGYVAGVYDVETVIRDELRRGHVSGVNIGIRNAAEDHGDAKDHLAVEIGTPSSFYTETGLDLYGEKLTLGVRATEELVAEHSGFRRFILPLVVLLLGIITYLFLWRLEKSHRQLATAQIELQTLNRQLKDLSRHDPLTQAYNRRAFEERLRQEISHVDRHGEASSLLVLDLDHFKEINDRWGHGAGDTVLKGFTDICRSVTRNVDMLARLGGEEFAMLLPRTDGSDALQFAERLRRQVELSSFRLPGLETTIGITVSIGIKTIDRKTDATSWFDEADKALYRAKQDGRNRVRKLDCEAGRREY